MNLWDVISKIFPDGQRQHVFTLFEDGVDFQSYLDQNPIPKEANCVAFVLGDEIGFTEEEEKTLRKQTQFIRVGPLPLLASHVIVITHNSLDIYWSKMNL